MDEQSNIPRHLLIKHTLPAGLCGIKGSLIHSLCNYFGASPPQHSRRLFVSAVIRRHASKVFAGAKQGYAVAIETSVILFQRV
jgi:hypothetical protein